MAKKIKICAFSGKRGGFGAYVPLMRQIEDDPELELQILLGDMHASKEFGNTFNEAKRFFPKSTIKLMKMDAGRGDTPVIRAENLGLALQSAPKILEKLAPDFVLVHGDRGEHLIVALAALNLGIPVGHTQGGDVSGNIDDIQRHAISKLVHLHFPETKESARRIRGLGEEVWRINVVGSVYIDRITQKMYTDPQKARKKYGVKKDEDFALMIHHADTFETREKNYQMAKNILRATKEAGLKLIATYPSSDPGYEGILKALKEVAKDSDILVYKNIDNLDFLALMSDAKFIIGNSSSSLKEAPYFQLPAINVGKRQVGRDREENVVDSDGSLASLRRKIKYVLEDKVYRKKLAKTGTHLGDGRAGEKIIKIIKKTKVDERLMRKKFSAK